MCNVRGLEYAMGSTVINNQCSCVNLDLMMALISGGRLPFFDKLNPAVMNRERVATHIIGIHPAGALEA